MSQTLIKKNTDDGLLSEKKKKKISAFGGLVLYNKEVGDFICFNYNTIPHILSMRRRANLFMFI
jgi:phage pi2 protein 07